jgi:hypothetical protein
VPERLTDAEKVERLEARVAELEDTVLYLAQTLGVQGVLKPVEVDVARRMYSQGQSLKGARR